MTHEQQNELLCEILTKLVPVLDSEELSLLAFHLGIKVSEFYGSTDEDLFINQQRIAA